LGIVRRIPGYAGKKTAKKLTKDMGDAILRLVNFKRARDPIDEQTELWLDQIDRKLRDRLVKIGLIDDRKNKETKPLTDYLPEFQSSIKPRKANTGDKQAKIVGYRARRLIEDCNFGVWRDISREAVDTYIEQKIKDGMSQQTMHFYIQAFRRFTRWMVEKGYARKAPKISSVGVSKNYGRAFELDEFEKLLQTAKDGPVSFGMTGYERFLVYLFAMNTGLRRGELRSLTPASFDFKNNLVFVKGEDTKNGDEAVQFFTPETSELLQEYVFGKMPNVRLFNLPDHTAKMIKADCKEAGIEIDNNKGKLTFHSLRHTCGSYLASKNVHPKKIQKIMRHKDINLTMTRYTHLLRGEEQAAVNCLPRFVDRKEHRGKSA